MSEWIVNAEPKWKPGQLVNFDSLRCGGKIKTYYGSIHKQVAPNAWSVVGFGFSATVCGDDLRETKPKALAAVDKKG